MIRFHNLPSYEKGRDQMVRELNKFGYEGEESHRLADAASSVCISLLRSLDSMIERESTDSTDQTIIQQLVLHQVVGISQRAMEANALEMLVEILKKAAK